MRCVLPLRCVLLLLLSLTASSEEDIGDLYDILGVDEAATDRVIKSAYRKLSLQHHPDKGGDPDRFKEITTAYEVLSDGEKRSLYDAGGMSAVTQGSSGQTDPWGRRVGVPRGDNVQVTVNVHLEDMYKGGRVRAKVRRRVVCRSCSREAVRNRRKRDGKLDDRCDVCGPTCPPAVKVVQRRMGMMIVNQEQEVPSEEKCKEEVANLTTTIEKGVPDGKEIVFERASEQTPGHIPGNVVLRLQAHPHAVFRRSGDDLSMTLTISLKQALLGFKKEIRHLDGHAVTISNDGVSSPGQVLSIAGEGMPIHGVPSEFGKLNVELKIEMPTMVTAEERAFVASHFN